MDIATDTFGAENVELPVFCSIDIKFTFLLLFYDRGNAIIQKKQERRFIYE